MVLRPHLGRCAALLSSALPGQYHPMAGEQDRSRCFAVAGFQRAGFPAASSRTAKPASFHSGAITPLPVPRAVAASLCAETMALPLLLCRPAVVVTRFRRTSIRVVPDAVRYRKRRAEGRPDAQLCEAPHPTVTWQRWDVLSKPVRVAPSRQPSDRQHPRMCWPELSERYDLPIHRQRGR